MTTQETIKLAIQTAKERNIKDIVVASSTGSTLELFKGTKDFHIVGVSCYYENGTNKMSEEKRKELQDYGFEIVTAGHALSGAERCFSRKFGGYGPIEIMANTLRMFSQGTKVCVEISTMALDAGKIPYKKPIIAVAGTGRGADTILILTPSYTSSILDTKIHEIITMPY